MQTSANAALAVTGEAVEPKAPPRTMVERKTVFEGGIISETAPRTARETSFPSDAGPVPYLQYAKGVKGGVVNFHVLDKDPQRYLKGRFLARFVIMEKIFDDGTSYTYVDLFPVEAKAPTQRLAVVADKTQAIVQDGQQPFRSGSTSGGMLLVMSPSESVRVKQALHGVPKAEVPAATPKATLTSTQRIAPHDPKRAPAGMRKGKHPRSYIKPNPSNRNGKIETGHRRDRHLENLISQGWQVVWDNPQEVRLKKGKREFTHKRPRAKR